MESAWKTLIDVGAVKGKELESRLTPMGRFLSELPMDLKLGKVRAYESSVTEI